jgi:hypothetical protein
MNELVAFATPQPVPGEWLEGYEAAVLDAEAIVDELGGSSFANFSSPILLRLKTRLIELRGAQGRAAA